MTTINSNKPTRTPRRQNGVMLLGLAVAVGIIGSVGGLLLTSIFQFSQSSAVNAAHNDVSTQATRASRWLVRDVRRYSSTDVPASGTVSTASFSILTDSGEMICDYSLVGTDLTRTCDGNSQVVGNGITNLQFSRSGSFVQASFDVESPSRPGIEENVDLLLRSDVSNSLLARLDLADDLPEGSSVPIPVIDFDTDGDGNSIPPGTIIDDEWDNHGITVFVDNTDGYGGGGDDDDDDEGDDDDDCEEEDEDDEDECSPQIPQKYAMTFGSGSPTGGDNDLGSPNTDFGGPGVGSGGRSGQPGENDTALGNVLIISEDGHTHDPDDNYQGGTLGFRFDTPVSICSVGLIDVTQSFGTIEVFDTLGFLISSTPILDYGSNGVQEVMINEDAVSELRINLPGDGGVFNVRFSC